MSGGFFDYKHFCLTDIAQELEEVILENNNEDYYKFSEEILQKFNQTIDMIRKTQKMITRVDYLLEGDDGPESFLRRWAEEDL